VVKKGRPSRGPERRRVWDRNRATRVEKGKYDFYRLVETIPPEQAFRPLEEGGCPLVK
jgi:hypothetical protein